MADKRVGRLHKGHWQGLGKAVVTTGLTAACSPLGNEEGDWFKGLNTGHYWEKERGRKKGDTGSEATRERSRERG